MWNKLRGYWQHSDKVAGRDITTVPSSYEMPTVRFWRPYKADFSRDSQCVNPIKPYEVLNSRAIKKKKKIRSFVLLINRSQPSQLRHLDTGFLTFTFKPFQLKILGWSFWFWSFDPRIIDICSRVHKCSVMSSIQFFLSTRMTKVIYIHTYICIYIYDFWYI